VACDELYCSNNNVILGKCDCIPCGVVHNVSGTFPTCWRWR